MKMLVFTLPSVLYEAAQLFSLKCEGYKALPVGRVYMEWFLVSNAILQRRKPGHTNFYIQPDVSLPPNPYTGSHSGRLCLDFGIKILLSRSYHLYYKCRFHRSVIPLLWNVVHCKWKAVRIQYSNPLIWNFIHSQTEKEIDCKD